MTGDSVTETHYTPTIKNLFQEYYKRNLTMGEYRAKRKLLIDQMDREFNGAQSMDNSPPAEKLSL